MRIEEAIPALIARGGVVLEMLVCDMNAPPDTVVGVARAALPLLAPAAALVLTFKNSFGKAKAEWHAAKDAALAELRTFADGVEVLHLLANTSRETTVFARVRGGGGGAGASEAGSRLAEDWLRSRAIRAAS